MGFRRFATGALKGSPTGLGYIDLALLITTVLLFATDMTVLFFHVMFVLVTLGAFFWALSAFVWRAAFWISVTTIGVVLDVLVGRIPAEELVEIPLLSAILVVVFMIARRRAEAQALLLEQDQAFLEAVLENMDEAVVACDAEGKLAFSNNAARLFHGLPARDLPLERWPEHYGLHPAGGGEAVAEGDLPIFRALRGESVREEEFVVAPVEGQPRVVLVSGNRMKSASGALIGAVVVVRDITQRKHSEEELVTRARQGEVVAGLGQRALASYDLYALMDEATSLIARTLGVGRCGIFEALPKEDGLLLVSGVGWPEEEMGEAVLPGPLAERALSSAEPVTLEGGQMGVAVRGQERHLGVLCAFATEQKTLNKDDAHFLQAVANVIGSAYDRKTTEERLYEVQEDERERIARDLHDTVLQDISHALRVIEASRTGSPRSEAGFAEEGRLLRRAVQDLRNSIYDLRTRESQEQSFASLLGSLVGLNREISPALELVLDFGEGFPEELPQPAKTEVLRIVQEALVNVRRHASASGARVELGREGDTLTVEVRDDGRGFEPETAVGGLGLRGMRERAHRIGGEVRVRSEFGKGTDVRFEVAAPRLLEGGPTPLKGVPE